MHLSVMMPLHVSQRMTQAQYNQLQAMAQQRSGIIWVQGEPAARSYLVGAGQSVLLMDSEADKFYLKSADSSGMPMPLRIFEYTEKTQNTGKLEAQRGNVDLSGYVTKDEFEKRLAELKGAEANG